MSLRGKPHIPLKLMSPPIASAGLHAENAKHFDVNLLFDALTCRECPNGQLRCTRPCHVTARGQTRRQRIFPNTHSDEQGAGAPARLSPKSPPLALLSSCA